MYKYVISKSSMEIPVKPVELDWACTSETPVTNAWTSISTTFCSIVQMKEYSLDIRLMCTLKEESWFKMITRFFTFSSEAKWIPHTQWST